MVAALSETLRNDPWPVVRMCAANSLGQIGDPTAVPALCAFLAQPHSEFWELVAVDAVTEALRLLGSARAIPLLLPLLGTDDCRTARKAAEVLKCLGADGAAVEAAAEAALAAVDVEKAYGGLLQQELRALLNRIRTQRARLPVPVGEPVAPTALPIPAAPEER